MTSFDALEAAATVVLTRLLAQAGKCATTDEPLPGWYKMREFITNRGEDFWLAAQRNLSRLVRTVTASGLKAAHKDGLVHALEMSYLMGILDATVLIAFSEMEEGDAPHEHTPGREEEKK